MAQEFTRRVLDLWFPANRWASPDHPPAKSAPVTESMHAMWFEPTKEFDEKIRTEFEQDLSRLVNDEYRYLNDLSYPEHILACIIALDQFPRNIYRGDARAFNFDFKAKQLSELLITNGIDKQLPYVERTFVYLPFQHSESLIDQEKSVILLEDLIDEAQRDSTSSKNLLISLRNFLIFAKYHRDIIKQFTRFPHRNAVLKRTAFDIEKTYLRDGGERFGQ